MNGLYFKYGTMNSGKTANALMLRHNYIQNGYSCLLLKSTLDTRDFSGGRELIVKTRIGLSAPCVPFTPDDDIIEIFENINSKKHVDVIIVDECQFASSEQIDQLKVLSSNLPVFCYGLLTDFKTNLFDGSKRLIEISDNLQELASICTCGKKATVNARFIDGKICTTGDAIAIEKGNITYKSMCYSCFKNELIKAKCSENTTNSSNQMWFS